MSVCGNFAILVGTCGILGYFAFMIVNLVGSIQALVHKGDSTCTDGAFKWIWWICISSALFAWNLLTKSKDLMKFKNMEEFGTLLFAYYVCSLGFALGTQFDYLDGCDGHAHTVMFIYMWGHYAVVMCMTLTGTCFALGAKFEQPTPPATPALAAAFTQGALPYATTAVAVTTEGGL